MNKTALKQRRADLKREADTIFKAAESGGLTDEQRTRLDAIEKEQGTISADLERFDRHSGITVDQAAAIDPVKVDDDPSFGWKGNGGCGAFYQAVIRAEDQKYRSNEGVLRLHAAVTGASEGQPSDGGFLVPPEYAAGILDRVYGDSPIVSRCQMIPISSNSIKINAVNETSRVNGSRLGGVQAYWTEEGGTATSTKPTFRQMSLNLRKLMAIGYLTDELLEDSAAIEGVFNKAFQEEITFKLEDAVINGTGAGQPLGILNGGSTVSVAKETGQAAATLNVENITKMYSRLWARSRGNGVWFYNQDIEPQLFTMGLAVGLGGVPIFMPSGGLSASPFNTILGRPAIPIEQAATLGTVGDLMLLDLSQYVLASRGGIKSATSMHVRFLNDEQVLKLTYRVDGQPVWNSALTPFKGSNTQSPFITLATRA